MTFVSRSSEDKTLSCGELLGGMREIYVFVSKTSSYNLKVCRVQNVNSSFLLQRVVALILISHDFVFCPYFNP